MHIGCFSEVLSKTRALRLSRLARMRNIDQQIGAFDAKRRQRIDPIADPATSTKVDGSGISAASNADVSTLTRATVPSPRSTVGTGIPLNKNPIVTGELSERSGRI